MKTILLSLTFVFVFASCSEDNSCHCNMYQLTFNEDGAAEQTLVDSKKGYCTDEDIANSSMVEEVGCDKEY